MKTIEKLVSGSYITEVATVVQAIIASAMAGVWSSDAYLTRVLGDMSSQLELLLVAINRNKVVSDLDSKDKVRDTDLRALYYLNNGYLHYPMADVVEAAGIVGQIFDNYGLKVTGENYAQESAHIESLLIDFTSAEALAAIALLPGVSESIAKLTASEAAFMADFVAYEEAKAKEGEYANATAVKYDLVSLVNEDLVVYLRAMRRAMPDTYEELAAATAQIIDDNNVKVKKRRVKPDEE